LGGLGQPGGEDEHGLADAALPERLGGEGGRDEEKKQEQAGAKRADPFENLAPGRRGRKNGD